jgi:hypothetical protein
MYIASDIVHFCKSDTQTHPQLLKRPSTFTISMYYSAYSAWLISAHSNVLVAGNDDLETDLGL